MNKQSTSLDATLIQEDKLRRVTDELVIENCLQLKVNYRDFSITMQTPGNERYLARGLLFTEGVNAEPFLKYELTQHPFGAIADIQIQQTENSPQQRQLRATAACGVCGKKSMDNLFDTLVPITKETKIHYEDIYRYYETVATQQKLFQKTGGCHAAGIFNKEGKLICVFEDIGRHNAVDKAIGFLLEHNCMNEAYTMTVSGRVSFEIIQKCNIASIPILLAISAPSSLAVNYAQKANVTLVAFCRKERATIYSHPSRIMHNTQAS